MDRYFKFSGSAKRSEYWGVYVISFVILLILLIVGTVFMEAGSLLAFSGFLIVLASIVGNFWLTISVTVRRCRDAGINPWWTAACYIPYLGLIPWIIIGCLSSDEKA